MVKIEMSAGLKILCLEIETCFQIHVIVVRIQFFAIVDWGSQFLEST